MASEQREVQIDEEKTNWMTKTEYTDDVPLERVLYCNIYDK